MASQILSAIGTKASEFYHYMLPKPKYELYNVGTFWLKSTEDKNVSTLEKVINVIKEIWHVIANTGIVGYNLGHSLFTNSWKACAKLYKVGANHFNNSHICKDLKEEFWTNWNKPQGTNEDTELKEISQTK